MRTYPVRMAILSISSLALYLAAAPAIAADQKIVDSADAQQGKSLNIKPDQFDTEQARKFMTTGQNPYLGDQAAIAQGKKLYQLYSCTQCHGSQAQGQTAVGLTGPKFNNAKSATDKGMFEIIWGGTNAGMGAKGKGLMDPNDPKNGMSPDEILKVIAWIRSQGGPPSK